MAASHVGYIFDVFAGCRPGNEPGTKINDGSSVRLLRKSRPQPCKQKPSPEQVLPHDSHASISSLATKNRGPRCPLPSREASPGLRLTNTITHFSKHAARTERFSAHVPLQSFKELRRCYGHLKVQLFIPAYYAASYLQGSEDRMWMWKDAFAALTAACPAWYHARREEVLGLVSFRAQQPFSLGVQPPSTGWGGGDGGAAEIQEAQPPLIASPPPSRSHPRASTLGVSPLVKGLAVTRSHGPCTLGNELPYL